MSMHTLSAPVHCCGSVSQQTRAAAPTQLLHASKASIHVLIIGRGWNEGGCNFAWKCGIVEIVFEISCDNGMMCSVQYRWSSVAIKGGCAVERCNPAAFWKVAACLVMSQLLKPGPHSVLVSHRRPCKLLPVAGADPMALELALESQLQALVAAHRQETLGLSGVPFDASLGHVVMQALAAYEQVSGLYDGNACHYVGHQCLRKDGGQCKPFPGLVLRRRCPPRDMTTAIRISDSCCAGRQPAA